MSDDEFIPVAEPAITDDDVRAVEEVVRSGWVSSAGDKVPAFEEAFAEICDRRYGVAVHNGTVAIHLVLEALDIGDGDEVIVPDVTFAATAEGVAHAGAEPVLAEVDPRTWTLDPEDTAEQITADTEAIVPVHLYGHPANLDPLGDLAEDHGLHLVEDAAEAHGAEYKDGIVGSFGTASTFSFYGNKLVTTGEGGMILTDDEELADRMARLRDHAQPAGERYWHTEVGWNYRLTNMQAALGLSQLDRFDEIVEDRRRLGNLYRKALSGIDELQLAPEARWADSVYWLYSLLVPDHRDEIRDALDDRGIETRSFFYPLHEMPPYEDDRGFPTSTDVAYRGISLPSSFGMAEETVERVAHALEGALASAVG